jgi:hypothetical protein
MNKMVGLCLKLAKAVDFIMIICTKWLGNILRNDIYDVCVCVCVFACELLHRVEESDSCDKTDKIFILKQNNVHRQTIPFPSAVKRSDYLGGSRCVNYLIFTLCESKVKRTFVTDFQGINVSMFTRKETISKVWCKMLFSHFSVKPPGNVTIIYVTYWYITSLFKWNFTWSLRYDNLNQN